MERIYLSPPDVGHAERELLLDAFDSGWIAPLGPHVDAFEAEVAERAGVGHGAALSSGTAGLHLALRLVGVRAGDEVLTSTFTFAASVNAITYVGARPVLVDADPATWQLDPDLLAEALADRVARGRRIGAVVAVDLYGQCADYDRVLAVAAAHDVPVVEDAAEALGATYRGRPAGSFGRAGVFSFNGNKIITTSGGGMLVSDDGDLVRRARHLATQARDPAPHYQHSTVGYNYRLSNLLAAVGRAQLAGLDGKLAARRRVNERYREAFADLEGIGFLPEAPYGRANCWLTCITLDREAVGATADEVRGHLAADDVEARPLWKPMHLQPAFADAPTIGGGVSAALFARGVCLPSGSSLTTAQQERVVARVRECLGR